MTNPLFPDSDDPLLQFMQRNRDAAETLIPVKVEGWPPLFVRPLTSRDNLASYLEDEGVAADEKALRTIARVLRKETGERLFDPLNPDHIEFLGAQPTNFTNAILEVSRSRSAITAPDAELGNSSPPGSAS